MANSFQDLDSRVRTLEAKVNLLMEVAHVTQRTPSLVDPRGYTDTTLTLNELYRALQQNGAQLEKLNGPDDSAE